METLSEPEIPPPASIWPVISAPSLRGKPRFRWPAELINPLKLAGRLMEKASAVLRVVISPAMAATLTEPMEAARMAPLSELLRPTTVPIAPLTLITLRKSLVTEMS